MAQPFVKYIGGKSQSLETLRLLAPMSFGTYCEPMVGGGALFWMLAELGRLRPDKVILGDTNEALIETYRMIRDSPDFLIGELMELDRLYHDKGGGQLYYDIRKLWNEGERTAPHYVFLKQTSFNGLWRHNRQGGLNMAWGKYAKPLICDRKNIEACSKVLRELRVTLLARPYQDAVSGLTEGDFVYFDPPYYGRFDLYSADGFSPEGHRELIQKCSELSGKGVQVLYSNESCNQIWDWLDEHWRDAKVTRYGSRRYVNRDGAGRAPVEDIAVRGPWGATRPRAKRLRQVPLFS